MRSVSRRSLLGLRVQDCHGKDVGRVVDTWPDDGGYELELVVVRLPRFGSRRMLPADEVGMAGGVLRAPYSRAQIEDAPEVDGGRHAADDPYRALAYWRYEAGTLRPPWRPRSGSSATLRQFPMSLGRTPSAG
jgi:PRC-barrel domain